MEYLLSDTVLTVWKSIRTDLVWVLRNNPPSVCTRGLREPPVYEMYGVQLADSLALLSTNHGRQPTSAGEGCSLLHYSDTSPLYQTPNGKVSYVNFTSCVYR